MRAALAWLARTGLLYVILCAAIAFFIFAWPAISSQFSGENLRQDAMSVETVRAQLSEDRNEAQNTLESRIDEARSLSADAVSERLVGLRRERSEIDADLAEGGGMFDTVRPSRILATKRLQLRRSALDAEITALEAVNEANLREAALRQAEANLAEYARVPTERAIALSRQACSSAKRAVTVFDQREDFDRAARNVILSERATLVDERDELCANAERRAQRRARGIAAGEAVATARNRLAAVENFAATTLPDVGATVSDTTLRDIAWRALLALLLILAVPFLIRLVFYYVLAPLAEKGPPIRLSLPTGLHASPVSDDGSRPSLQLTLNDGEELLVRQSYLQSSPANANMRTRWLMSWRNPLTSLASGMAFLTRARSTGATFGISARDDPFAEIASITMPSACAMVIQPRALAAIVQPVNRPMQVRSRWRLFSLHAWLTFQFRYLVFHGPGTLVMKGGRGVRVEAALSGRRFGQDQLIGFSAHTAYAITRTETFLPYFFGREPLFRDRVTDDTQAADGILVIEEAPMAGRRGGIRGGLEGAFDAFLKAFGI